MNEEYLLENTVSQELKKLSKEMIARFRKVSTDFWADLWPAEVDKKIADNILKWTAYQISKDPEGVLQFINKLSQCLDYIFVHLFTINFTDTSLTVDNLKDLSDAWHQELARSDTKIGMPGAIGKKVMKFSDGWSWVDLGKGFCRQEGKAMGHCGNAGQKRGDTILSLRNPRNIPYATFILNDGKLGEMKGRNNLKPIPETHKYIIALLKSPIVKKIVGGGYMPRNNFALSDLKKDEQEDVVRSNPSFLKNYTDLNNYSGAEDYIEALKTHNFFEANPEISASYPVPSENMKKWEKFTDIIEKNPEISYLALINSPQSKDQARLLKAREALVNRDYTIGKKIRLVTNDDIVEFMPVIYKKDLDGFEKIFSKMPKQTKASAVVKLMRSGIRVSDKLMTIAASVLPYAIQDTHPEDAEPWTQAIIKASQADELYGQKDDYTDPSNFPVMFRLFFNLYLAKKGAIKDEYEKEYFEKLLKQHQFSSGDQERNLLSRCVLNQQDLHKFYDWLNEHSKKTREKATRIGYDPQEHDDGMNMIFNHEGYDLEGKKSGLEDYKNQMQVIVDILDSKRLPYTVNSEIADFTLTREHSSFLFDALNFLIDNTRLPNESLKKIWMFFTETLRSLVNMNYEKYGNIGWISENYPDAMNILKKIGSKLGWDVEDAVLVGPETERYDKPHQIEQKEFEGMSKEKKLKTIQACLDLPNSRSCRLNFTYIRQDQPVWAAIEFLVTSCTVEEFKKTVGSKINSYSLLKSIIEAAEIKDRTGFLLELLPNYVDNKVLLDDLKNLNESIHWFKKKAVDDISKLFMITYKSYIGNKITSINEFLGDLKVFLPTNLLPGIIRNHLLDEFVNSNKIVYLLGFMYEISTIEEYFNMYKNAIIKQFLEIGTSDFYLRTFTGQVSTIVANKAFENLVLLAANNNLPDVLTHLAAAYEYDKNIPFYDIATLRHVVKPDDWKNQGKLKVEAPKTYAKYHKDDSKKQVFPGNTRMEAFKINFKEWMVMLESATIAQLLKQEKSEDAKGNKPLFRTTLMNRMPGLNQKFLDLLVNYFLYHHIKSGQQRININIIDQVKDFLTARIDDANLRKNLNDPEFNTEKLKKLSDEWHESLQKKARPAGGAGKELLDLSHLGANWKGWKWLSLGKGYCKEESTAGGHCGNVGAKPGDDILSLRDPENKVYATFIINDGMLGEMKGWGNHKPSPKLHPAIIELLKHPIVKHIRGGGYAPEQNFMLEDLDEETRNSILSMKPSLDLKADLYNTKDPQKYMELYGKLFPDDDRTPHDFKVQRVSWYPNPVVIFDEHDSLSDFVLWLGSDTKSTGLAYVNHKFYDSVMDGDHVEIGASVSDSEMAWHVDRDLDESNRKKMEKILGGQAWSDNEAVTQAIYDACVQGYEVGTRDSMDAWVMSKFDDISNTRVVKNKLFFNEKPNVIVFLDMRYLEDFAKFVYENMDDWSPMRLMVNSSFNVSIGRGEGYETEFSQEYFNEILAEKLDEMEKGTYA